jgi:hypothetical protein
MKQKKMDCSYNSTKKIGMAQLQIGVTGANWICYSNVDRVDEFIKLPKFWVDCELDTPFKILFILVPKRIRKLATYSF